MIHNPFDAGVAFTYLVAIFRYSHFSNDFKKFLVVAMGTSAPELVISLVAIIKKHHGISAGNLIGSNLFNTMGVLGVAGALRPLAVDPGSLQSIVSLIVLTVIVLVFIRSGWQISRRQGVALILISLVIWGYEIYRQSPQTAAGP